MNRETPELDHRWLIYVSRLPPRHPVRVELRCKITTYIALKKRILVQTYESMWHDVALCGMMWHYVAVCGKSMWHVCGMYVACMWHVCGMMWHVKPDMQRISVKKKKIYPK